MSKVNLQCKLARNYTLEGVENAAAYLLIKVIPEDMVGTVPLNVSLVLDVSGSMTGEKLECAKEAACLVVESLSKQDWLSLVVFSGEAELVVPRRKVDDKNAFFSRIKNIEAGSVTNMHRGITLGLKELGKMEKGISRMLLFTDGQTEGEDECLRLARNAQERQVPIFCFGIGDDYNEDLLLEIKRITLGAAHHLQHPEQIKEQFGEELKAAASIGIKNSSLAFSLAKGVVLQELHRIVPNLSKLDILNIDERNLTAPSGELSGADTTCFGARFSLPNRPSGQVRITRLTFSYETPAAQGKPESIPSDIIVEYTRDRDLCGKIDPEVMGYFDQLAAQDLVEQAAKAAKAGNVADATQKLNQAKALTQRIGNELMTQHLDQAIGELQGNGTLSAGSQKTIRLGSAQTVRVDTTR